MYIGDCLGRREIYSPEKLAVVDYGKRPEWRLTYRQLNERTNRLAQWLRDEGQIRKGDRVSILARDGLEHLETFFACGKLGAVHTPLNWRLHWRELRVLMERAEPKVLIAGDDFREPAALLLGSLGSSGPVKRVLHLEGDGFRDSVPYEDALARSSSAPVVCESLDAEDPACILFTGGTTGLPKAALISHRMIAWNVLNTVIHDLTHDDVVLNVFPLFHAGGLFCYWSSQVVLGGTTIQIPQFDPELVLRLIETEKVTVFAGVPAMYQMLTQAANWKTVDLSSLRFCTCGGAPLPVPVIEKYIREKGVQFKQGFGMTEFGPGLFALSAEDAKAKAGSIGRPNFFVDVRVVDEEDRALGPNEVGELLLKGPSMCSGYFRDPEATANLVDADGWFHTGDLVTYDEAWYFRVVDRKKDMFISGGENVYPVEIESVLYQHPAVHMAAVIGVPHPKWGEVGRACVVPKPGAQVTEEELLAFMASRLARYKVPKSVEFLDALPFSGMGKPLKRELRERYLEMHSRKEEK